MGATEEMSTILQGWSGISPEEVTSEQRPKGGEGTNELWGYLQGGWSRRSEQGRWYSLVGRACWVGAEMTTRALKRASGSGGTAWTHEDREQELWDSNRRNYYSAPLHLKPLWSVAVDGQSAPWVVSNSSVCRWGLDTWARKGLPLGSQKGGDCIKNSRQLHLVWCFGARQNRPASFSQDSSSEAVSRL